MSVLDNFINGYSKGHGVRFILQTASTFTPTTLTTYTKQQQDLLFYGKTFLFTVYDFNPSAIVHNNDYGWSPMRDQSSGESLRGAQVFNPQNIQRNISISGNIYPKSFIFLDKIIANLISKNDVIQDIQDLDFLASKGTYFKLTKVGADGDNTINAGNWFIKSFNYSLEDFIYNQNPLKIGYNITLEKKNPDDE